jgi:hypothetical protein
MKKGFSSIEEYLEYVGWGRADAFGKRYRSQFRDRRGTAELAMLAAPSEEEYEDFHRAVEAMTEDEKAGAELLGDEQIREIAQRAQADTANVSIFINGYVLAKRKTEAI